MIQANGNALGSFPTPRPVFGGEVGKVAGSKMPKLSRPSNMLDSQPYPSLCPKEQSEGTRKLDPLNKTYKVKMRWGSQDVPRFTQNSFWSTIF